jgi:hypothetical protein
MKSANQFVEAKRRHVFIFGLIVISFIMMSCLYSPSNSASEGENRTPKPNISNGLVMNGTATIIHYFGDLKCTNTGTAILTVNPDTTIMLRTMQSDISTADCSPTGDQLSDRATGKYNYDTNTLFFSLCNADLSTESTGWLTADEGQGDVICYGKDFDGKATKFLIISFDVKK